MKIVKKFKDGLWRKISLPMKDYKPINGKAYSSSKMGFFNLPNCVNLTTHLSK
jgi:hypothetical protein